LHPRQKEGLFQRHLSETDGLQRAYFSPRAGKYTLPTFIFYPCRSFSGLSPLAKVLTSGNNHTYMGGNSGLSKVPILSKQFRLVSSVSVDTMTVHAGDQSLQL